MSSKNNPKHEKGKELMDICEIRQSITPEEKALSAIRYHIYMIEEIMKQCFKERRELDEEGMICQH